MTEPTKLQRLAEYYDTHDTSTELERAELVDEPVDTDLMVSLSLRLPKSLLDWVRTQARAEHTKPTQLIRRWIEERHHSGGPSLEERVRRLEDLVQRSGSSGS
ncbi:MAG TPA: hypothetical protein VFQ77_16795 [Pseudonocardiaceae bacterium]|jgi:hypothetical protein|nr:hypothetical protein [Pseudonocardiaceae bacterium]